MSFESKIFAPDYPFSPKRVPFFYGWIVFFVSVCTRLVSVPGHGVGLCPFTEELIENLSISRVHFSNLFFFSALLSTLLLPLFGKIFDRMGIRRSVTYSTLVLGLGLLFMGRIVPAIALLGSHTSHFVAVTCLLFWGLFLLKLCGQNLIPLASRMMLLHWYDKKSCTMVGISGIFISLIFGCSPKIIHLLVEKLGYLGAWTALGVVILFGFLPLIWALCRDSPQSIGLSLDGLNAEQNASDEHIAISRDFTLRQALGTFDFWMFVLAASLSTFTATGFDIHVVDIFREAHAPIGNPLNIFPFIAVISAISGVLFSILLDRISIHYCLVAIFATNAALMFFMENVSSPQGLGFFIFIIGFNWALYGISAAAPWPKLFGRKYLGQIMSTSALIVSFSASIAPSAFSYAQRDFGSYFALTRIIFFSSLIGLIVSIIYIARLRIRREEK
jgi:MFS family permease